MTTPMIAEIRLFAGNFAPRSWAFCQGQILSIAQNTALFSLLGTTYGGNGQTTFALPDFRGRLPYGTGQGPGLPTINLGQIAGSPTHTLIPTEMPAHNHGGGTVAIPVTTADASSKNPSGKVPAATGAPAYATPPDSTGASATVTLPINGGSQPFSIEQPYLGMNFIIAVEGVYPSRN